MKKYNSLFRTSMSMFAAVVVVVASYTLWNNPQHARTSKELVPEKRPRIQIADQPDSPLGIVSVRGDFATAHVPQVELVIINRSNQPVRAYTIRYQTFSTHSKGGGMELENLGSINSLLQPGYTASAIVGEGASYTDPMTKIVVSVDFVELKDGTTWGPNEYKSDERLAGQRAGAHQATEQLMKILSTEGPFAVVRSLEAGSFEVIPPNGHSPEWSNGFEGGVGSVRVRLKNAYGKSGLSAIESELRRPFDASDRR